MKMTRLNSESLVKIVSFLSVLRLKLYAFDAYANDKLLGRPLYSPKTQLASVE